MYLEILVELRSLWDLQKDRPKSGVQTDIFEIEAIGPLIALRIWPQLLADRPWVHFIVNSVPWYWCAAVSDAWRQAMFVHFQKTPA